MESLVLTKVLIILCMTSCAVHAHGDPSPSSYSSQLRKEDLNTLLAQLQNTLLQEEKEKMALHQVQEDVVEAMQRRRKCYSDTKFEVQLNDDSYNYKYCVAMGMPCLEPNANMPPECINEQEDSCRDVVWNICDDGEKKSLKFVFCIEGGKVCVAESPLMPCMGGGDLLALEQVEEETFTICHKGDSKTKKCVRADSGDLDTALTVPWLCEDSCIDVGQKVQMQLRRPDNRG